MIKRVGFLALRAVVLASVGAMGLLYLAQPVMAQCVPVGQPGMPGTIYNCVDPSTGNSYQVLNPNDAIFSGGAGGVGYAPIISPNGPGGTAVSPVNGGQFLLSPNNSQNTTFINGMSSDGSNWSGMVQTTPYGRNGRGGTVFTGTDTNGQGYTRVCNQYGCF